MAYTGSVAAPQSFTFRDGKNQTCQTRVWYNADAGVGEADLLLIDESMLALTDSQYVFLADGTTKVLKAKGLLTTLEQVWQVEDGTGPYYNVADKAEFFFLDIANKIHKIQVACPKSTIFLSDLETVDFTNAAVKLFVANVTFTTFSGTAPTVAQGLCGPQGDNLVVSIGGLRRRGKMPKRFNIFTRAPSGGQGE